MKVCIFSRETEINDLHLSMVMFKATKVHKTITFPDISVI